MADVILQNLFLDPAQRGAHRADLRHDVDAVAILVDHLRKPAHLAFDPVQPFLAGCLDLVSHGVYVPLRGIGLQDPCTNPGELRMAAQGSSGTGGKADAYCGGAHNHAHHGHTGAASQHDATLVVDPVCGMKVDAATSKHRHDYNGRTWHFCS